jgi:ATP-dependent DNA helicase RecG
MEQTTDGFRIAEEDLKIRGPGDFTGVRQSGIPDLVFADLVRDAGMLQAAKEIAEELRRKDPDLASPAHEGIRRFLARREAAGTGAD